MLDAPGTVIVVAVAPAVVGGSDTPCVTAATERDVVRSVMTGPGGARSRRSWAGEAVSPLFLETVGADGIVDAAMDVVGGMVGETSSALPATR